MQKESNLFFIIRNFECFKLPVFSAKKIYTNLKPCSKKYLNKIKIDKTN